MRSANSRGANTEVVAGVEEGLAIDAPSPAGLADTRTGEIVIPAAAFAVGASSRAKTEPIRVRRTVAGVEKNLALVAPLPAGLASAGTGENIVLAAA